MPLPRRVVVYLSGGGYRAAIAAIGALLAIVTAGQWQDVRKIVSVSGGGLANAWIAIRRPTSDDEVIKALEELYGLLMDRRRSMRHLLIAAAVFIVPAAAAIGVGFTLAPVVGGWIWAYGGIAFFVSLGALLWLAPRVFLAQDYKVFSGRLGSLSNSNWHREHVFVASELWLSGYVGIIAHTDQSFIAAPPLQPMNASAISFSTALRASTALPPLLPAVRLGIKHPVDPMGSRDRKGLRRPNSLWLVDGGVTGNLGIQSDPGITGVTTQFDTVFAAQRGLAAAFGTLTDNFDDISDQLDSSQEAHNELVRWLKVTLIYDRLMRDPVAAPVLRRVRSEQGEIVFGDLSLMQGNSTSEALEASRRIQRQTVLLVRTVLNQPELEGFELTEEEQGAFEEPVRTVRDFRARRPDCGHGTGPWSSCTICPTMNLIVDASGRPSRPGWVLRLMLWIPGAATIVNAIRTLQILYQENLQEDRKASLSGTVPVLRADDIYLSEARVSRSRTPAQSHTRWILADTGISGPWRASLPLPTYVRAQLREDAANFKTQLMAPSFKDRAFARATLASAYLGTADLLLGSEADLDLIDRDLKMIDGKIAQDIHAAISAGRQLHAELAPLARTQRGNWVLGLREGLRTVARAGNTDKTGTRP